MAVRKLSQEKSLLFQCLISAVRVKSPAQTHQEAFKLPRTRAVCKRADGQRLYRGCGKPGLQRLFLETQ